MARYRPAGSDPTEEAIRQELARLVRRHRRYGTPRLTALIRRDGRRVNHKRVERLYREGGLTLPTKRPKRKVPREGSGRTHPATRRNEVWSYDFVHERTEYGEKLKLLVVMDEHTRECVKIRVERKMKGTDVQEMLEELFAERGAPVAIRSDNGSEFKNRRLRQWLKGMGVEALYVDPGSPWQNGFVESLNGKLRDECLDEELFYSKAGTHVVVDWWTKVYNEERPHTALGYRTPAQAASN
jgi:transposase InsO family protein